MNGASIKACKLSYGSDLQATNLGEAGKSAHSCERFGTIPGDSLPRAAPARLPPSTRTRNSETRAGWHFVERSCL
jgi:hypothetical protein